MTYIFGYGSLIWKSDFPFVSKKPCTLKGYIRRFWQLSTDHRGTEETPGRVVTLIKYEDWELHFKDLDSHAATKEEEVTGFLFEIAEDQKSKVFEYLDFREKNGYTLSTVNVTMHESGKEQECYLYIAHFDNDDFIKKREDFSLEATSRVISSVKGPSGYNKEYLIELVKVLRREFGRAEQYLEDLCDLVLQQVSE